MPLITSVTNILTKALPKVLSSKEHAAADYCISGAFLLMGGLFWQRNKRAAIGSLACGTTLLGISLLTDYPGGIRNTIALPTHARIDLGVAAMVATMPEFLEFRDEPEERFFLLQAALLAAMSNLTEVEKKLVLHEPREHLRAA